MKKQIIFLILFLVNHTLYAKTTLSGDISSDTTISGDLEITDDLLITKDASLTVMPGTVVKGHNDVIIYVYGTVKAIGNENDSIRFTSAFSDSEWSGFTFSTNNIYTRTDSSILEYCVIEKARKSGEFGGGGFLFYNHDRIRISHCRISGNTAGIPPHSTSEGGGIVSYSSSIVITDCKISDNSAASGGGIYLSSSSAELINCKITDNNIYGFQAKEGGGLYLESSSAVVITDCIISNNTGGGIGIEESSPDISGCDIIDNSYFTGSGGGIFITNSSTQYSKDPVISNCNISGNSALSGGGIYVSRSTPVISDCKIENNTSSSYSDGNGNISHSRGGGGILSLYHSVPVISNCLIRNNSTDSIGGGICAKEIDSVVVISNCEISGNLAEADGGGIHFVPFNESYSYPSLLEVSNSILVNNTASHTGAAIYNKGIIKLINTTIADNHADPASVHKNPSDIYTDSILVTVNSIISGSIHESSEDVMVNFFYSNILPQYSPDSSKRLMSVDPQFKNADNGDYSLAEGSEMINAGTENTQFLDTARYDYDLAGNPRIKGVIDIGAYEYNQTKAVRKPVPATLQNILNISFASEKNILFIENRQSENRLYVTDIKGNILRTTHSNTISLSDFAQGIYYVVLENRGGNILKARKFFKFSGCKH